MKSAAMKVRLFNIFCALTMVLASIAFAPVPVQAQSGANNAFLPIVVDESAPKIQAAGSCYWGRGSGRFHFRESANGLLYIFGEMPNTSSCRDVNIHVEVSKPNARGCNVSGRFEAPNSATWNYGWLPRNRWWVVMPNLSADYWTGSISITGACGSGTLYWAS